MKHHGPHEQRCYTCNMNIPTRVLFLLLASFALSNGGSREYHYFPELKTWREAQSYCKENHVDLATFETEEEWSKVQLILQNVTLNPWIGLYDDNTSWRWSLDGTYLFQDSNTPFGNWMGFHTDNWNSNEHCADITTGHVNDNSCSSLGYFVCYDEPTNSYSNINSTGVTWLEAQSFCRLHYTDLASIRSQQEKDAIMQIINYDHVYWIGLSRESWKWSDKSIFTLKKWAPNEGLNTLGEEYCATAGVTGFKDDRCDKTKPFLCTVPVMKTYKVEFKTDSLNPDDPVVQDSLLQEVERVLREHEIHQNFTLNWRQQANGKLFRKKET